MLGSAAVLAVYSAGYFRTRAAAEQFDAADLAGRRPSSPAVPVPVAVPAAAASDVVSKAEPAANGASNLPSPAIALEKPSPLPATATAALAVAPTAPPAPPPAAVAPVPVVASSSVPAAAQPAAAVPAAPAGEVAAKVAEAPRPKWKDGKFSGWGSCRHGDIEATIEIKGGRIVSAIVSDCRTRYACDVIDKIIPQVVARQSADVDTVSGATQSADAFYYAVTAALASAKPEAVKAL